MTSLHPFSAVVLVAAAAAMLTLPRRLALLPMVLVSCIIVPGERVLIFGLDFPALRVMILVGIVRVMMKNEARIHWNHLDRALIAWTLARTLIYTIRKASGAALVQQLGNSFEALGFYFLGRILIRNWRDVDGWTLALIIASVPTALAFLWEGQTGTNPFGFYDSVDYVAGIRGDAIRARGPFSHSILAGVYWVAAMPLIAARYFRPGAGKKALSVMALCASLLIVAACRSSTPLIGLGVILIGVGVYPLRSHMRAVRWSLVGALFVLQVFVMQKPLWHLFYRVGALGVGSSTGYHRYRLFDAFVTHWKEWVVMGISGTERWGRQLGDTTSFLLAQGMQGGIVTLGLFATVLVLAFIQVGQILKAVKGQRTATIYAWALGLTVLAHVAMINAVHYYEQVLFLFYLVLAAVGSLTPVRPRKRKKRARAPAGATRAEGATGAGTAGTVRTVTSAVPC